MHSHSGGSGGGGGGGLPPPPLAPHSLTASPLKSCRRTMSDSAPPSAASRSFSSSLAIDGLSSAGGAMRGGGLSSAGGALRGGGERGGGWRRWRRRRCANQLRTPNTRTIHAEGLCADTQDKQIALPRARGGAGNRCGGHSVGRGERHLQCKFYRQARHLCDQQGWPVLLLQRCARLQSFTSMRSVISIAIELQCRLKTWHSAGNVGQVEAPAWRARSAVKHQPHN